MTLVYHDPTLLASTLTPFVELADKVVRLQRDGSMSPALKRALLAVEERIAERIGEFLEVKPATSNLVEDYPPQTFKVGDCVRIARRSEAWSSTMEVTLGRAGTVQEVGGLSHDAVRVSFEDGDWWWYHDRDLDLVSPRTAAGDPK